MSPTAKMEYLKVMKPRYQHANKSEKQLLLDEFCTVCHYNRKYAICLLNNGPITNNKSNISKRGRKKQYDHPMIREVLVEIWIKTNLPFSKRFKAILPLWLSFYKYELSEEIKKELFTISPSTIDRLMLTVRSKYLKQGLATRKHGSILEKHISIKTNQ